MSSEPSESEPFNPEPSMPEPPTPDPSSAPRAGGAPIFVVGCQRSGTTVLRLMLDSHPDIACGPETRFLRHLEGITGEDWHRIERFGLPREYWLAKVGEFFASFQAEYAASRGKRRWADKSPLYALLLDYIWEIFPDAQVIHIIRDVKDVTSSHRVAFGYKAALGAPRKWTRYITQVRRSAAAVPADRYHEVRFETLIGQKEPSMRAIIEFLGEPWDDAVLDYEKAEHDVNPRYWKRTTQRRQGSTASRRLDPLLALSVRVYARAMRRELGYSS